MVLLAYGDNVVMDLAIQVFIFSFTLSEHINTNTYRNIQLSIIG